MFIEYFSMLDSVSRFFLCTYSTVLHIIALLKTAVFPFCKQKYWQAENLSIWLQITLLINGISAFEPGWVTLESVLLTTVSYSLSEKTCVTVCGQWNHMWLNEQYNVIMINE